MHSIYIHGFLIKKDKTFSIIFNFTVNLLYLLLSLSSLVKIKHLWSIFTDIEQFKHHLPSQTWILPWYLPHVGHLTYLGHTFSLWIKRHKSFKHLVLQLLHFLITSLYRFFSRKIYISWYICEKNRFDKVENKWSRIFFH